MKRKVCLMLLLLILLTCFGALGEGIVIEDVSSFFTPEQLQALQETGLYDEYLSMLSSYGVIDAEDVADNGTSSTVEEKAPAYEFDGVTKDLLTIETVEVEPYSLYHLNNAQFFSWKMKVRNTSGNDLTMNKSSMRIWYRYLDENEDTLWSNYLTGGYSSTVKNGRAEWIEESSFPYGWGKKEFDEVVFLEIYGYTTTLHGSPDYEFENPILINVKEYLK